MSKRITLLLIALLLAAAGLYFTLRPKSSAVRTSVRIGTFSQAIDYAPFYVAKHFKWFEEQEALRGVPITYTEFKDRDSISASFAKNELEAVFCAEPPAIITRAQGDDIRIVAVSCTLQQEIVVRRDLSVNSALDLRGKKIAVLQGTSSHYGLLRILGKANLSPDTDVAVEYMGPGDAKTAFESGKVDAWAVWPPFVEEQQVAGRGRILTGGDAVIQSVMAVPSASIRQHPEVVKQLVATVLRAKMWLIEHPEEAQSIVATQLGLDVQVVKAAWSKHRWESHLTPEVIKDIEDKAVFLEKQKALRRPINVQVDLIDSQFDRVTEQR